MVWSSAKMARKQSKIKTLTKDFLSSRFSAAGVSYLVDNRSKLRRFLWLLGLLVCTGFMGYMTVKVVLEYLRYPKNLIIEDVIVPRLPFPAVTVCPLNPINTKRVSQTSFGRLEKLRTFLAEARILQHEEEKASCTADPLCVWSWFLESCVCIDNPCKTELCMSKNSTHCYCSFDICEKEVYQCTPVLGVPFSFSNDTCLCNKAFVYRSPEATDRKVTREDILSRIKNTDVHKVIDVVLRSKTNDLSDVDGNLMPSMEEMYKYSISFQGLIPSCSYETVACERENFTLLYHPKYGKCYMFNYVGAYLSDHKSPVKTHAYGSSSGLRLVLRVIDKNTLDLVRRDVGARVVVHDPYKLPLVTEFGVNIRPLDMTALGVSLTNMTRLPQPWGNCVPAGSDHREPYSILACEKQCELDRVNKDCNCSLRALLTGSLLTTEKSEYRTCQIQDSECVQKVEDYFDHNVVDCGCRPPCQENIYSFTVTSSKLNANYFKTVKAIRTLEPDGDTGFAHTNVSDSESMAGVKVYYRSFQVSQQMEVASYSWETFIANIGGNLGFFMGLSLVTSLEIIEFVIDIFIAVCSPTPRVKSKSRSEPSKKSIYPNSSTKSMYGSYLPQKKLYSKRRFKTLPTRNVNIVFCKNTALSIKP